MAVYKNSLRDFSGETNRHIGLIKKPSYTVAFGFEMNKDYGYRHANRNRSKLRRTQSYTKNYRQKKKRLKVEEMVFPRAEHTTGVSNTKVSPQNIHISTVIQTEQVVLIYLGMCVYTYTCVTIHEKEVMNLNENKEGYMGGL